MSITAKSICKNFTIYCKSVNNNTRYRKRDNEFHCPLRLSCFDKNNADDYAQDAGDADSFDLQIKKSFIDDSGKDNA